MQMINVGDYIERNVLSIKSFRGAENLTGSTLEGLRDAMRALQR